MSKIQDSSLSHSIARIRSAKNTIVKCSLRLKETGEPLVRYLARRFVRPIADTYAAGFELGAEAVGVAAEAAEVVSAALNAKAEQYPSLSDVGLAFEAIAEEPSQAETGKRNRRTRQRANRRRQGTPAGAEEAREHFHGEAGKSSKESAAN